MASETICSYICNRYHNHGCSETASAVLYILNRSSPSVKVKSTILSTGGDAHVNVNTQINVLHLLHYNIFMPALLIFDAVAGSFINSISDYGNQSWSKVFETSN